MSFLPKSDLVTRWDSAVVDNIHSSIMNATNVTECRDVAKNIRVELREAFFNIETYVSDAAERKRKRTAMRNDAMQWLSMLLLKEMHFEFPSTDWVKASEMY